MALPNWLLGRNVSSVTASPCTVAADGTVTVGSAWVLTGWIDGLEFNSQNTTENIQSIDNPKANYVITENETTVTMTEILKGNDSNTTPRNYLAQIAYNITPSGIVQFSMNRGGRVFTFVGVISTYAENINKGKSTGKMELKMVDTGSTISNPTLV